VEALNFAIAAFIILCCVQLTFFVHHFNERLKNIKLKQAENMIVGWHSSVVNATGYGLDGTGI
jgi:hypothetical protein